MILGLDMATTKTGYGLLDKDRNLYDYNAIRTKSDNTYDRVKEIYDVVLDIITTHNVDIIIFEDVPINKRNNLKVAKDLCVLQGVIIGLCFQHGIPYKLYNPTAWRSLVGTYDGTREGTTRDVQKRRAVEKVNEIYDLGFVYFDRETKANQTDDDKAEAICLGLAYIEEKRREDNEI